MASAFLAWTLLNIARDAQVQRFVISATQILLDLMLMDSVPTVFKDGLKHQTRPIRTASTIKLLSGKERDGTSSSTVARKWASKRDE